MTTIINFTFLLSWMIIFMNHPLSMGMILLMQVILISLITGMMSINFWMSYILFIIMVGGMLVLFIYMTSIASNEKFTYSSLQIKMLLFSTLMLFMLNLLIEPLNLTYYTKSFEIINNYNFLLTLSKFMNYPYNLLLFTLIIYLFITLIAVVKISKIKYGPLRHMN